MNGDLPGLRVLDLELCVVRLPAGAPIPEWLDPQGWHSVTRTDEELSIVCTPQRVPENLAWVGPFGVLKVAGPLEFSMTGVLNGLSQPLAKAGISIFALSTYDTDYILVRSGDLDRAAACLREVGVVVRPGD